MIPDRLQYFLEHFWKEQKCDQIWTLGHRSYHQNTSTIPEYMGTSLNIFFISEKKFWFVGPSMYRTFWKFEIWKTWNFVNLGNGNEQMNLWRILELWKPRNYKKNWKFENMKMEIEMLIWKAEIRIFEILKL